MRGSAALKVLPEIRQVYSLEFAPATPRSMGLARRQPTEMRCVMCDRPALTHGTAIDVGGGEMMVPVCEALHPGGLIPEGPTEPVVRPLHVRRRRAAEMPLPVAHGIAGNLGQPSKMPGTAYGIDAWACMVGSELAEKPGSVCHGCYARKNFYRWWYPAVKARAIRQAAITHPMWTEAMIALIWQYLRRGGEPWFRWHDSGDLQSVEHLARICAVSEAVPSMKFWLPTREYSIVAEYLGEGGRIPDNLTVRVSAHWIGRPPEVPEAIAGLPSSTVHEVGEKPIQIGERRRDSVECRAYTRDNNCGKCRACWSPDVRNVSYGLH